MPPQRAALPAHLEPEGYIRVDGDRHRHHHRHHQDRRHRRRHRRRSHARLFLLLFLLSPVSFGHQCA